MEPSVIHFDEQGIRENIGNRVLSRPWSWVIGSMEDGTGLTLFCEEGLRTGRLSKPPRSITVPEGTPRIDELRQLLATHSGKAP